MTSLILNGIVFILIAVNFYLSSKRTSLLTDIKWGLICHRCKSDAKDFSEVVDSIVGDDYNYTRICKSCNREVKFNQLESKFYRNVDKFNRYIVSNKYEKLQKIILSLIVAFVIGGIIIDVIFDTNAFVNMGALFNIIFWSLLIYRQVYTSKKKVSQ